MSDPKSIAGQKSHDVSAALEREIASRVSRLEPRHIGLAVSPVRMKTRLCPTRDGTTITVDFTFDSRKLVEGQTPPNGWTLYLASNRET